MATGAVLGDAEWHSSTLHKVYVTLGWFAFTVSSVGLYPQVLLNYRRKSVEGLNFDFVVLNLTRNTSNLLYNVLLYFSPAVKNQYWEKFGESEIIPVGFGDVVFSVQSVLLLVVVILQIYTYERGAQKLSLTGITITTGAWGAAQAFVLVSVGKGQWLSIALLFNNMQVIMNTIVYLPQAWFNYIRKSTVGWSIVSILLEVSGGLTRVIQMPLQSIDQKSWANLKGNFGKLGWSLETLFFDVFFIIQHYVLYREGVAYSYHPIGDLETEVFTVGRANHEEHDDHEHPSVVIEHHVTSSVI